MHLLWRAFPLGLAPRMARLTLAFLPSMIGFGSLHARSAASFVDMITCKTKTEISVRLGECGFHATSFEERSLHLVALHSQTRCFGDQARRMQRAVVSRGLR